MKYIIAIDQSTSASKAFLIDSSGAMIKHVSRPHKQYYPAPGRVEHNANEIWSNVESIIAEISSGIPVREIACISISNQRETTVLWDAETGEAVCPAIVWQDVRGEKSCRELAAYSKQIHELTGLPLSPYYPAGKLRAFFQEQPEMLHRAQAGELLLGTIDSYLIYRMTGNHFTDTTNASRTQLMDLRGLSWNNDLLKLFGIPKGSLPQKILHADDHFGTYHGVDVIGVLGDSHAALFGQGCHAPGTAKATYGTGSSVMMNIGKKPIISHDGLSASVAFSFKNKTHYALEGNITSSGDTLIWLCDTHGLFESPQQIETYAVSVSDAQGVNFIPAFSGLGAPYFDSNARASLYGINRGTTKAHIAYAALASIAHQDADILEIMQQESGYTTNQLFVDGGACKNSLLMQMQADYANCTIHPAPARELSALGAAYIGGIKAGVFHDLDSISARNAPCRTYTVKLSKEEQYKLRQAWKSAIHRTLSNK